MKTNKASPGTWLTDRTVPKAKRIYALRYGRFGVKSIPCWLPQEPTFYYDSVNHVIYGTPKNATKEHPDHEYEITDFSSTPAGDGHKGVLRGSGRLHDLMDPKGTPVLFPTNDDAFENLAQIIESAKNPVTEEQLVTAGWKWTSRSESIWTAGAVYYRMLVSGGFPKWRAFLHRVGLRGLGLQYLYRWLWAGSQFEYLKDRKHVI